MLPYRTIEAIQHERAARLTRENQQSEARRKAARRHPGALSELLGALSDGLALIGYRGRFGDDHPARPAY